MVDALVSGASVERRAGSSPVLGTGCAIEIMNGEVAELVDALVSGASVERRAGSSPVLGTDLPFGKEIFQNSCKATMRRW